MDLEAVFCMKNRNLETNNLNPKPEIMQTNTLSAFNPRQKTMRAYLINHVTTRAMIETPKSKFTSNTSTSNPQTKRTGKTDAQSRRRRRKCKFIQECICDDKCICTENAMHE